MELDNWVIFLIRAILALIVIGSVFGFIGKIWHKIRRESREEDE